MCAGVVSIAATFAVMSYARRRLIDLPNARSSHVLPTPRGGGVGIVIGLLAGWLPILIAAPAWDQVALVVAVVLMSSIGFWDDHVQLPARVRLLVQAVSVAIVLVALCFSPIPATVFVYGLNLPAVTWQVIPFALLGAVWIVNLTNFMDGIDGIAASQAAIALGIFAWWLTRMSDPMAGAFAAAAAAAAGFLVWNWPPARIFMGDVGSTTLGLLVACAMLRLVQAGVAVEIVLMPYLPFVLDATGTLIRRAVHRERLSAAHRSHFYQRSAQVFGHRRVTLAYSGAGALGAAIAEWGRFDAPAGVPTLLWVLAVAPVAWWMSRSLRPFPLQ